VKRVERVASRTSRRVVPSAASRDDGGGGGGGGDALLPQPPARRAAAAAVYRRIRAVMQCASRSSASRVRRSPAMEGRETGLVASTVSSRDAAMIKTSGGRGWGRDHGDGRGE